MSARQSGIWPIPAGFSKPSSLDRSIRAIAPSTRPSPICSIRTTRRSDRATRGRNAACCRARPSMRSAPIATTSPRRCCDLPMRPAIRRGSEAMPLIELGLNHEQQHQELMLMDIKHVFSVNPLLPAYQAPRPYAVPSRDAVPGWIEFAGGLCEIGHDGSGFAFDNEGPRHKVWLEPYRLGVASGHLRRVSRFHHRWRLSPAGILVIGGLGLRAAARLAGAALLARRGWRVAHLYAGGRAARSSRPSRSAMSAFTRPTRLPAGPEGACRPRRNGRMPPPICR